NYAFSQAGTLVYFPLRSFEKELVWVDRKGVVSPVTDVRRSYSQPRLSPDGSKLAVTVSEPGKADIWIYDLTRNAWDRLTSEGWNVNPVWFPDGRRLAFGSNRNGPINTFWVPLDRSSAAEQLTMGPGVANPYSFSPDGRALLVRIDSDTTAFDVSILSMEGDRKLRPLIQTPANEGQARFSPDGRWIAYASDESGRT